MNDFTRVKKRDDNSLIYQRKDGSGMIRSQGTLSWRNNNPGNITYGDFAKGNQAIGQNGRFAVFPDVDTGYKAIENLFQTPSYKNLTLDRAMNRYAPNNENDTDKYLSFIEKETGLSRKQFFNDLDEEQRQNFVRSISKYEGFKNGDEFHFKELFDHPEQ